MFPAARSKSCTVLSVDWSGLPTAYVCVWYSVRQKCFPETMCVRGYEAPQLWARGAARARRDAWSGRHPVRTRSGAAAGLRGRRGIPRAEARAARCGQRRRKGGWWEKGKALAQRERGPGTGRPGKSPEGVRKRPCAPLAAWGGAQARHKRRTAAHDVAAYYPSAQHMASSTPAPASLSPRPMSPAARGARACAGGGCMR